MNGINHSDDLPLYRLQSDGAHRVPASNELPDSDNPKQVAQLALDQWNCHVRTGRDSLGGKFLDQVSWLMDAEVRISNEISGWPTRVVEGTHDYGYVLSSGTQGSVASALFRAHLLIGNDAYGEAARRALRALETEILDGGVGSVVGAEGFFLEDVAIYPASHNLCGFAFGLIGLYDYVDRFKDPPLTSLIGRATSTMHTLIGLYDTGNWTRVDLLGGRLATVEEHALHVRLLRALAAYSGCQHCANLADTWAAYGSGRSAHLRRTLAEAPRESRRAVVRAAGRFLFPPIDRAASPTFRYPVCISLSAFPVAGGTRAIVTAIAGAMADEWDVTYLTNTVGPNRGGLDVERFGGRLSTPWQFPNVWLHALAGLRKISGLIRRGKEFRLILPQDGSYTALFSAVVGRAYGARVVSVEHGTVMFPYSPTYRAERVARLQTESATKRVAGRLRLALYWPSLHVMASIAARLTDQFLVAGDEIEKTYCERLGVNPSRIVRFNPSIDTDLFRPLVAFERDGERDRIGVAKSDLVIAMNGRLAPEKGLDIALEAVAKAFQALPADFRHRLRLLLAGDGPSRAEVEATMDRNGLTPISRLLGEAEPSQVAALLGIGDIFLYTSLRGTNTSLAVLEAMAAGCAVIASEQPQSHAKLLADGRGISTHPGDLAAVTSALVRVLQDDHLRADMGRLARDYVIQHYSRRSLKRAVLRATFYSPLGGGRTLP